MHKHDPHTEAQLIADILANCEDWPIQDLRNEVGALVIKNCSRLSPDSVSIVLNAYFELSLEERASQTFDHVAFVRRYLDN